ncbi:iron-containing alcohol dehydrogenase family protein [Liquorilactobacillus uvarum]|uniref:iron-containing alcohol dehydrogenase family protein n=1 Tax=Liquorilactobacillus uvarum TaxID=303240 RepID=UPI000709565D|nr:iron-containing alcohol dehydrogenase family protein [Liquorilactobacillus uvarum]
MIDFISRIGPQQYITGNHVYEYLNVYFQKNNIAKALFLHGEKALHAARPYLPKSFSNTQIEYRKFSGECSLSEINDVTKQIVSDKFQAIVGIGGGKVLDTVKSVAATLQIPVILLPTLVSNCAPWSSLSVHYQDDGTFSDFKTYAHSVDLLLLEEDVLFNSPVNYFVAGLADTLAKYYESELMLTKDFTSGKVALEHAAYFAQECQQIILNEGEQAITDMLRHTKTKRWLEAAETIIVTGGLVGGFSAQYGRATGAHSIHDALTQFPETHAILHGVKVGYGVLVQLALEKKLEEAQKIWLWLRSLELPTNLAALGLKDEPEVKEKIAVAAISEDKSIHLLPINITEKAIFDAITDIEELNKKLLREEEKNGISRTSQVSAREQSI